MEKKIENYLPFYLGCYAFLPDGTRVYIEGIYKSDGNLYVKYLIQDSRSDLNGVDGSYLADSIKLILRPLSDMTEEECEFFYHWYFDKRYAEDWSGDTGSAYFKPKKIKPTYAHIKRIIDGDDYRSDSFMRVVELTKWLLDLHFDLFNLIDAGLAIDSTTLKQL